MKRALRSFLALGLSACGGAPPAASTPAAAHDAPVMPHFVPSEVAAVHGSFVATLDPAVTSFGAALLDGRPCVAGGYFGTPHDYDREGQSSSFACLDASGSWQRHAPLETTLQGFALVDLGFGLARCGGSRIDNAPDARTDMHSVSACAAYDAAADAWHEMSPMPSPRSSFDAAVLDGRLYAIGGWNIEGDQDHATFDATMATYDIDANTWSAEPSPIARRALAVVATSHAIVAIGGLEAGLHVSRAVDVFDPAAHAWSHGPDFPGEGFGMAAVAQGDAIYASGADGMVYRWSVGEPAWSPVHALAQPRFFHRLLIVDGALWAIGGIGGMSMDGRATLIESVPLEPGVGPAIGWAEISFPGRARNRFGLFAAGDVLYVFGGNDSAEQHDFAPTNFVDEVFRLHVPSLRWFPLAPLPEGRQSLESVWLDEGHVLALGGFGHDGHAARTFADGFAIGEDDRFTIVRDALPAGRTQFGATVFEGAVWIFAGLVFDESLPEAEQFTHLDDVLRCPITNGTMGACETIEAHLPGTRRAFAGARVGDHFYLVGGMRDGFAPVDDCFAFDLHARTFAPFACPAHVRISATMLAHEDRLVLVGGSAGGPGGLTQDRSVEVYDPAAGAWSTAITELPFSTHQGRWAFVGDRLVMVSTQAEAHRATLALVALP